MRFKLLLILFLGNICQAMPIDFTKDHIWYYVSYSKGHPECLPLNLVIMLCPTNALNERIEPIAEINREIDAWDEPIGCNHLNDNIALCELK